jgi:hypothetical protein
LEGCYPPARVSLAGEYARLGPERIIPIRSHVSNILGKLGVSRRMEAAAIAHHLGLALPEG